MRLCTFWEKANKVWHKDGENLREPIPVLFATSSPTSKTSVQSRKKSKNIQSVCGSGHRCERSDLRRRREKQKHRRIMPLRIEIKKLQLFGVHPPSNFIPFCCFPPSHAPQKKSKSEDIIPTNVLPLIRGNSRICQNERWVSLDPRKQRKPLRKWGEPNCFDSAKNTKFTNSAPGPKGQTTPVALGTTGPQKATSRA